MPLIKQSLVRHGSDSTTNYTGSAAWKDKKGKDLSLYNSSFIKEIPGISTEHWPGNGKIVLIMGHKPG
ncbi:hypothetical protein OQX61_18435 [Pedobacter sp. PLR]|uniref:hypothetical protein n=1 Tax=Pedobacter sp. PLR TaxID=2994465 RepID=UPI002247E6D1|nr:hypothetical protein [Pedobacter sp. PLR]MCX2453261.1 hypothetical protein [Pedobacter sp. PLR]